MMPAVGLPVQLPRIAGGGFLDLVVQHGHALAVASGYVPCPIDRRAARRRPRNSGRKSSSQRCPGVAVT